MNMKELFMFAPSKKSPKSKQKVLLPDNQAGTDSDPPDPIGAENHLTKYVTMVPHHEVNEH